MQRQTEFGQNGFPPGDEAAAQRLIERLAGHDVLAAPGAEPLLRFIGGHSPYLSDLTAREPQALLDFLRLGPQHVVGGAMARLGAVPPDAARDLVGQALRAAKRVVSLAVALADITAAWSLEQVTGALSDLAGRALQVAVGHLLRAAHDAGKLRLPNPDQADGSGFVVLAMGKLGARELNYSSDIDLILLHDPLVAPAGDGSSSALFTRMARDIVALMETRDQHGYVFRTDLRLRPDPAATPLCVSLPTALSYYEGMAQTWERAAMIKARPVAGDLAVGQAFVEAIRPFVWRRSLDFSAVADLHAMKRRIDAHKGEPGGTDPLAGRDVKLGRGGIREIEFVAQTMQLVWGGRDPRLRLPPTVAVLRCLTRAGHLRPRAAGELIAAYRLLRRVEHRLQMVADRQTHALPPAEGFAQFAAFMGYAAPAAFAHVLMRHLRRVERRYADVFVGVPDMPDPVDAAMLRDLGFIDPAAILLRLHAWSNGEARSLRSERARSLLAGMLPDLLRALSLQPQPDLALTRFDRFLGRLPAGVSLLSLFDRNRGLLDRLAGVLGAAAPLADHLASTPSAIEGLLSPPGPADPQRLLATRLVDATGAGASGLEEAIRVVQRTVREEDFSISLATLEGRLDADRAGLRRTELADAAIGALLPRVMADMARRHGTVPGGEVALVLLGKAGGREMMAGSDLDLMLIFDRPEDVAASVVAPGCGRSLAASAWFIRLVHGLVGALSAPDAAGAMYAIDMRLRPSGNKGPVAVSLAAFRHYHRVGGEAWTWERMALTRARVVAGTGGLPDALEAAIRDALAAAGPAERIRADAAAMRARLQRDAAAAGPPYALKAAKLRPGGLIDVEFIAQTLQLVAGPPHPKARSQSTRDLLAGLDAGGALASDDAAMLIRADHVWRTVLGMLRLIAARDGADPVGAAAEPLLRAVRAAGFDAVDDASLHGTLDSMADTVRSAFVRLIGKMEVGAS